MTSEQKKEFMVKLIALIDEYIVVDEPKPKQPENNTTVLPNEMLTVKECAQQFEGLSEHTVRQFVLSGEVKYIRAGTGKRGKILVNKASLMKKLGFI